MPFSRQRGRSRRASVAGLVACLALPGLCVLAFASPKTTEQAEQDYNYATLLLDDLRNDLEGPVVRRRSGIGETTGLLLDAGARRAGMTGSGSAVFGLFERRGAALGAVRDLRTRREGWTVCLTRTMDRARLERRFRV